MDGIFIVNKRTKQILLYKEYKIDQDNKISQFIDSFHTIINNERSPYVVIQDNIFTYIENNDSDDDILYISKLSQEVNNI